MAGSVVIAGLLGFAMLQTPAAQAHGTLVSTEPAAGSKVDRVPRTVTLTFAEPEVGVGSLMVVTGPSGDAGAGQVRLVDRTVSQDLASGSPAGEYQVIWRVTSADGHPVSGQFTFTANHAGGGAQAGSNVGPAAVAATPASVAVTASTSPRWWLVAFVAIGAAAIALVVNLRRRRREPPAEPSGRRRNSQGLE